MSEPQQKPFRSRQDYATPGIFIAAVKDRLGISEFSYDLAAINTNAKAPRWCGPQEDALSVNNWPSRLAGGWGWLNPPFTTIGPWASMCRDIKAGGGSVAFLVPAAVGSNWFRDYVNGHALVLLLNGRLAFMEDQPTWLFPKDCILCLYSPSIEPGYEVWTWKPLFAKKASA